jgi:hypothetical protein
MEAVMPRYKFNVVDGTTYTDKTGTELPDDNSALAEGAQLAREVKADNRPDGETWSVEVKQGTRVVSQVPFNAVD